MARRIIKKIGGDRIGSGGKMTVAAHGYGYSTHDVSKVRRTSMSFGTIVPMGMWLMTSGSRLRLRLDALITSNALLYQLYGSAKFQLDVFSARMALYNPKMLLNLNDQGYDIADIKFPQMGLITRPITATGNNVTEQVNGSALLRYLGIAGNGQREGGGAGEVGRLYNAMWLLMYYQTVKEYYANRQEGTGLMIHNPNLDDTMVKNQLWTGTALVDIPKAPTLQARQLNINSYIAIEWDMVSPEYNVEYYLTTASGGGVGRWATLHEMFNVVTETQNYITTQGIKSEFTALWLQQWRWIDSTRQQPRLVKYDLKEIDKMQMKIMSEVEATNPVQINDSSPLPYGASFKRSTEDNWYAINTSQEGLCLGTYQSDVFNNWLDNTTINLLNAKSKVKVDANGEFTIDMLNITQKLYNYDMRIGITDGTLDEWREMTYAQVGRSKSLKPVYEGGLSKEIVFDMVVSTASTDEDPLGTIASRGQFGNKHKGGYAQIEGDEEKLVMVLAKITPRLVYNQGNDWTVNLQNLDQLHKPALDKIGYQNLLTDQIWAGETRVSTDGNYTLTTYSAGKQPAWQWYRTNFDDALGNMADTENYKVFGREYSKVYENGYWKIKDLTTYIDPMKFNDVFALKSLDAMNFDVQVGMDATMTLVMSEEVIPNL